MSTAAKSISIAVTPGPPIPDVPIYHLTVEQYLAMGEAGILMEDDRVEFLKGWLVERVTKTPPHIVARGLLLDLVPRLLPAGWFLSVQHPIAAPDSLPEPDVIVIRGTPRDYLGHWPTAEEITLVVEVADSSLDQDRGLKKRVYAEARIIVYWIVNLIDGQIEVYTDPTGPADEPDYRQCRIYVSADEIPVELEGNEAGRLPVRELLP